jgi:hypothetical protein
MSIGQLRCKECGRLTKAVSTKIRPIIEMQAVPDENDKTKTVMKPTVIGHICKRCDKKALNKKLKERMKQQEVEAKKKEEVNNVVAS